MNTLDALDAQSIRTDIPDFRAGDTLKVHARVVEGNRSRIQIFQGVVIRRQGGGLREFTIRKVSFGVGVERTYSTARSWTGSRSSAAATYAGRSSTTCATSAARKPRSRSCARRSRADRDRGSEASQAPGLSLVKTPDVDEDL
jgi:hypothetical protein